MRRLAALIIGVATAQPVQNYYGNADPHLERRRLAKRVPGSSTAAITEQLLCAAADTVVMCNRRGHCSCGRGLDSGFVSAIKFYRARMGLSVRSDVAGGIFSFK